MVIGVFILSSVLNYLDRQILAALAPLLRSEFGLSNAGYGGVLAAFSIAYAVSSPLAGLLIDRFGLNRGISAGVGLWSLASVATGFVRTCRGSCGAARCSARPNRAACRRSARPSTSTCSRRRGRSATPSARSG